MLSCALLTGARPALGARPQVAGSTALPGLSKGDTDLLDDISRRSFRYFWDQTDLSTGLVADRARTDGEPEDNPNHVRVASIAATGFGLTAFCIAADHRWISREMARERVLAALVYFTDRAPEEHGWFYHYLDPTTGERRWNSEVSSIDTALLLAGVLTARQYFGDDRQIVRLATAIYERVDFPWMMDGSQAYFSHGWTPESGFLRYRWDTYSELMILYLLAIGSPTHPISPDTWYAWKLPVQDVGGYTYVGSGPLFVQQYSQAWVDLRDRVQTPASPQEAFVPRVDYFANAVAATRAQQQAFSNSLSQKFPGYNANVWGLTASDSSKGYTNWGASPQDPRIDGTVVPSAAAGSLMFAPDICIPALRTMLVQFGKKIYGRYGFADAFNPTTGWVSQYAIGIDVGITLLSAENLRTGNVWQWFMSNPEPERALDLVGLRKRTTSHTTASVKAAGLKPDAPGQPAAEKPQPYPEILITSDAAIPASFFQFKIPIPIEPAQPNPPPQDGTHDDGPGGPNTSQHH
ncbi:MAG TPA: glucoamylase family protein [Terriglobia bacterium]|nr:glucoamylase family protein [Terriglobia bacterium]